MSDDDEVPTLPPDTLAILQHFLSEKSKEDQEDWQLSQFWYDEETTNALSNAVGRLHKEETKVALLCCPTLCQPCLDRGLPVTLFEFDKRFSKFGDCFQFYDYREPLEVEQRLHQTFDLIVADPPFLSEECLSKTFQTVNLLRKSDTSKIILCTGVIMEETALRVANVKPCGFIPRHKNNLANEFCCYTNFGELPV